VAEKTGYPRDMLDLDLDLEADLGVDTVKQAETFAAIRTVFNIPRQENLKLRDYPTLASVIQFVRDNRPDLAQPTTDDRRPTTDDHSVPPVGTPPVAVTAPPVASGPSSVADKVTETVLAIVAEKTGYPIEMLDLDLDLEADLGVDTVKQAETFAAIRTVFNIPRQESLKLRDYPTLASVIQFVRDNRPDLAQDTETRRQGVGETGEPSTARSIEPASVSQSPSLPVFQSQSDHVTDTVLAIVAEKTGYPTEMLDLDLDLEADLGVDTVKHAETFAALRNTVHLPRQDSL
jgi:hypothetical protein